MQWRSIVTFVLAFCAVLAVYATPPAGQFSSELDTDLYDCHVSLSPAKTLSKTSAATLYLEWESANTNTQVAMTQHTITISAVREGKRVASAQVPAGVQPGKGYLLTVLRRGSWLGVQHDGVFLYRGQLPHAPGADAGITVDKGWKVDETQVQRLEPVMFSDDFMRTAKEQVGAWTARSGQWQLQSALDAAPQGKLNQFDKNNLDSAQNPFAWVGSSATTKAALCTTGTEYWEDYTFTAAVHPNEGSIAAGVVVNMPDTDDGFLVRWSPVYDSSARGNALILFKVVEGKYTEVQRSPGGYFPGQWYKMTVDSTMDGIQVSVDGRTRITLKNATPWRGGVALYAEGKTGVTFDDVSVYGHTLNTDLLLESEQTRIGDKFLKDQNGMKEWALNTSDWSTTPFVGVFRWYHWKVYGDHQWLSMSVKPTGTTAGSLTMVLNADGNDQTSGYRAVAKYADDGKTMRYTLYRGKTQLAEGSGAALTAGDEYAVRFWHVGKQLWLDIDDERVLSATDASSLTGLHAGYQAEGTLSQAADAMVLSHNVLQYPFTESPVDWLGDGTWEPTIRWSCSPNWSFLSGWSRGDAVLWHKMRFTGDQVFQTFIGPKMEYPRERQYYEQRYRDFAITICGDGHNPRTGYSGIDGAPAEDGTPNRRVVLMRNGVVVASKDAVVGGKDSNHRNWFDLQLHKDGATVEFWVEGQLALSYTDPNPIDGGSPAIWTSDNGISLARARIIFQHTPQPRTDAQVTIDDPWYPEWANKGRPLVLDFPHSWSSTGHSVHLTINKRLAPTGDAAQVTLGATRLSVTPKSTGNYWYQLNAVDKTATSPSFHLFFPVFDPSLGRDDTHAVVLYRFDEQDGAVAHDRGTSAPAADLTIAKSTDATADIRWLPGQGLEMRSSTAVMTAAGAAEKLHAAIGKSRACTMEFWLSTDTIYPVSGWSACLLTLENPKADRDLCIGHFFSGAPGNVLVVPKGQTFQQNGRNVLSAAGFRTGLQHIVVAWDGTTTRVYINGNKVGEQQISWNIASWTNDARIILGNQGDLARGYRGVFYLVAIHDRCLTDADVQRHYQAGPSAR